MVDFAYHVHTDVGNQMFGAKVNGKAVHAGHALANAEVVEVLTYDGAPTPGSIARHQVRSSTPRLCFLAGSESCEIGNEVSGCFLPVSRIERDHNITVIALFAYTSVCGQAIHGCLSWPQASCSAVEAHQLSF